MKDEDENGGSGHTACHVEHTAVEGDLQVAQAAEAALHTVGEGRHQVEQGDEPQKADAQLHDFGLVCKEADDGFGADVAEDRDADGVDGFNLQAAEEALADAVLFPGTAVLGHQGGGGVADVLLGDIGEIVDAAGGGERGHGVDAPSC